MMVHQETAKRVVEIALTGNHSFTLRPNKEALPQFYSYDLNRFPRSQQKQLKSFYQFEGTSAGQVVACEQWAWLLAEMVGYGAPIICDDGDMIVEMPALSISDRLLPAPQEPFSAVVARIIAARGLAVGGPDAKASDLVKNWRRMVPAVDDARCAKVERVAATIAKLAGHYEIGRIHIAEAISYVR